jgi:hypothetical protein
MRTFGGVRRIGFPAIAGTLGFLVAAYSASPHDMAAMHGGGSTEAGSFSHPVAPSAIHMGTMDTQTGTTDPHLPQSAPSVPFGKLVTRINWPRGRDGTERSLFAYGPSAKDPTQGYSAQVIWWTVDLTRVAAVDVSINGKRIDNPKDAKQSHTAIYRLGGQAIPGYTGGEGHFNWTIWPAGDFKFDFTVYDDAGNVIGTMSHRITVAPARTS